MSDKQGIPVPELPKGPDIQEHAQETQPGVQAEMETKPELTRLPVQHGTGEELTLEEYRGVGKLQGKVALITGGDSGIGLSAALMFAREKAKGIALVYLPEEQKDADAAKAMIEKEGAQVLLISQDLAEGEAACKGIVDQVIGKWNKLDILINNSAYQPVIPSITDTTQEEVERTFRTNVFPLFFLAKYAVPHMPRGSSIINTTSVVAYAGSPSLMEYSSTKGAMVSFTRSLAKQLAPKGIKVNGVAPGPIWTPLQVASWPQEELDSMLKSPPPLGRIGQPADCGPAFVFLASQETHFMTGQVLHVNGGMWTSS